jgi:hypothetical protein
MSTEIKTDQKYKSVKTGNILTIEGITFNRLMVRSSDGSYSGHGKSMFIDCINAGAYTLVNANKVDDIKPSLTEVNDRIHVLMSELVVLTDSLDKLKRESKLNN